MRPLRPRASTGTPRHLIDGPCGDAIEATKGRGVAWLAPNGGLPGGPVGRRAGRTTSRRSKRFQVRGADASSATARSKSSPSEEMRRQCSASRS